MRVGTLRCSIWAGSCLRAWSAAALLFLALLPVTANADDGTDFFEKKVRPVLVQHCYACHSIEAKKEKGGLRLDTSDAIRRGGESGPTVVAKDEASLLLRVVAHAPGVSAMPPKKKLPDAAIADLREWVKMGAPLPAATANKSVSGEAARKFWSLQPVAERPTPKVSDPKWPVTKADFFILQKLDEQKLAHAPSADPRALVRRVYFDLIGLPPTLEQVEAFAADTRSDAYERLVDKLIASPRFGEKWARHWFDVARYAEDNSTSEATSKPPRFPYRYRDWVIGALNADIPYDRFIRLQLAADLLPDTKPVDLAALGYLGLSLVYHKDLNLSKDVISAFVADEWDERVDAVTRGFLGLTVACARCHDHKFDPVTTKDYYALAGVMANTQLTEVPLKTTPATLANGVRDAGTWVNGDNPNHTEIEYTPGKYRDLPVFVRGDPARPGEIVPRRFLTLLSAGEPKPFTEGSGRRELADAIVTDAKSLTARVFVNRAWGWVFGRGIVTTPSNFGALGDHPTHPELLDDLAARFVANKWSVKWLVRELVLSASYRQSSRHDEKLAVADPDDRWLWRAPRKRLELEQWRDAMLQVSGQLNLVGGGPSDNLDSPKSLRRTVYGKVSRERPSDIHRLFDLPDPKGHGEKREVTTTPLQQLYFLNSPFIRQAATVLGRAAAGKSAEDGTAVLFRRVLLRDPTAAELATSLELIRPALAGDPPKWELLAQALLVSHEFLFLN
jgi:cytochrome c553